MAQLAKGLTVRVSWSCGNCPVPERREQGEEEGKGENNLFGVNGESENLAYNLQPGFFFPQWLPEFITEKKNRSNLRIDIYLKMETHGTSEPESIEVGAQGAVLPEMQQLSVMNKEKTNKQKPKTMLWPKL